MPCSQKKSKNMLEMWLALAATNKKVGAYNSIQASLFMKLLKQLSEWVAKRDISHKSFQDMLEATPDHVAHTYILGTSL